MAAVRDVKVDETGDRSSSEKYVHAAFDPAAVHDMPPDPDENLSAEEKAHMVGFYICTLCLHKFLTISHRIANSCGSLTAL
jgi:hypothetical protein